MRPARRADRARGAERGKKKQDDIFGANRRERYFKRPVLLNYPLNATDIEVSVCVQISPPYIFLHENFTSGNGFDFHVSANVEQVLQLAHVRVNGGAHSVRQVH